LRLLDFFPPVCNVVVGSSLQKENLGSARRGMGLKAPPRRNVLSAINNGGVNGLASPAPSEGGSEAAAPGFEFSGREDVERLLAEKMKGKSKNDYKVGSCDGVSLS
jgi:kinesin family protein C1